MEPSQETETTKWWQSDIVRLGILSIVLIVAIILLYQVNWSGLQDKNIWDWMELIIVPLVLAGGGLLLQRIEDRRTEREEAREKQQARDSLMDSIFQSYLDDMSDLMISHQLQTNLDIVTFHREQEQAKLNTDNESAGTGEKPSDEPLAANTVDAVRLAEATAVVTVARARTVTALMSLDVMRRNLLSNFLRETALVTGKHGTLLTHVDLRGMDLSESNFTEFNFMGAHFEKTNLRRGDLSFTNLSEAHLIDANLSEAKVFWADLSEAELNGTNLSGAVLRGVIMNEASLYGTNLCGADLSRAKLAHAQFVEHKIDEKTALPDAKDIMWHSETRVTYTKYWSKDTDMERYTNPDYPDFWEPTDDNM